MNALTYSKLANVQTLGIGLYLALAVIQAVSSGGVAGLRRRATALQTAVRASKHVSEYAATRQLQTEVSRVEVGFQAVHRTAMWVVFSFLIIGVLIFIYNTAIQDDIAGFYVSLFMFIFYDITPIILFCAFSFLIGRHCHGVEKRIKDAEAKFRKISLSHN